MSRRLVFFLVSLFCVWDFATPVVPTAQAIEWDEEEEVVRTNQSAPGRTRRPSIRRPKTTDRRHPPSLLIVAGIAARDAGVLDRSNHGRRPDATEARPRARLCPALADRRPDRLRDLQEHRPRAALTWAPCSRSSSGAAWRPSSPSISCWRETTRWWWRSPF